jgi:hypothetical protein
MQKKLCVTLMAAIFLQGCITYKDFPKDPDVSLIQAEDTKVVVRIEGFTMGDGFKTLADQFRNHAPFEEVQFSTEKVDEGIFIDVDVEAVMPSNPALVFGYISVSTLTILPFWSTQDGSQVIFTVYEDGERLKGFDYAVRRKGFVWILMLPLIWVNAFTPNEADAFEAITNQFFIDYQGMTETPDVKTPDVSQQNLDAI